MNIPDITNEIKSGIRSESVAPTQSVDRTYDRDGSVSVAPDAVQKQSGAKKEEEQSQNFSREEVDTLIKDAESQLEKNDVKLKFNVLEENDSVQVEIVDSDGKTIRKIPDDDLLKLTKSLKKLDRGFLDETS